jgi:hypothetical protein
MIISEQFRVRTKKKLETYIQYGKQIFLQYWQKVKNNPNDKMYFSKQLSLYRCCRDRAALFFFNRSRTRPEYRYRNQNNAAARNTGSFWISNTTLCKEGCALKGTVPRKKFVSLSL